MIAILATGAGPVPDTPSNQQLASAINLRPLSLAPEKSCTECHKIDPVFSHPVNVVPAGDMQIPRDLPLGPGGRLLCTTCHEVSAAHALRPPTHDSTRNSMLRAALDAGDACRPCHRPGRRSYNSKFSHALSIDRAHLPRRSRVNASTASLSFSSGRKLDSETRTCLSCHDGTLAAEIGRDGHEGHPVGIVYGNNPARAFPSEMPVKAEVLLDSRVRLFDGRVGCDSCHSPYSTQPNRLIMSNRGSALCLSCHGN